MSESPTSFEPCEVHSFHRPTPQVCYRHYVWPLDLGGPETIDNSVIVCPTGKVNIDLLLADMRINGGVSAYGLRHRYAASEVRVADLGWARYTKGAL